MISIEEAQRIVLKHTPVPDIENVSIMAGLWRVIAEDIFAPSDIPMSDTSAMDGYALSLQSFTPCIPSTWSVVDFIPAGGQAGAVPVTPGTVVKIMTGAPIPPGCDTVIPFEDVELIPEGIRLNNKIKLGSNIRKQGEDIRANELAIASGSVMRPQEIGLLFAMGKTSVKCYRKVRVAILATGDELVEPGKSLISGKIINSNTYALAAQVIEAGGDPMLLGIAADTGEATIEKIRDGLKADMLITSGGVSVGERDFVKEAIIKIGGEILLWKVNIKPGKPVAYAVADGKPIFALPGNPVAAMVVFEVLVRPAMRQMMGFPRIFRPVVKAVLSTRAINKGHRPHFITASVTQQNGEYFAALTGLQSSANLLSLTRGNGLVRIEPNTTIDAGSIVEITLLDHEFK